VFITLIRIPTINYGDYNTDKFLIFVKNTVLKFCLKKILIRKTCQICLHSFLTKLHQKQNNCNSLYYVFLPKLKQISEFRQSFKSIKKCKLFNFTLLNSSKTNQSVLKVTSYNLLAVFQSKLFAFSLLLRSGDVEPNPGPRETILSILTYNARGLKNRPKLKRILNKCHKEINENCNAVIFLQEA